MIFVKNKIKITDGVLTLQLPDEFNDKTVDVIIKTENDLKEKLLIDTIMIDTTKWKFDREEIYGR